MAGVSMLFGAMIALLATKLPFRPVLELMAGMDKLAEGDFHTRVKVRFWQQKHLHFSGECSVRENLI